MFSVNELLVHMIKEFVPFSTSSGKKTRHPSVQTSSVRWCFSAVCLSYCGERIYRTTGHVQRERTGGRVSIDRKPETWRSVKIHALCSSRPHPLRWPPCSLPGKRKPEAQMRSGRNACKDGDVGKNCHNRKLVVHSASKLGARAAVKAIFLWHTVCSQLWMFGNEAEDLLRISWVPVFRQV